MIYHILVPFLILFAGLLYLNSKVNSLSNSIDKKQEKDEYKETMLNEYKIREDHLGLTVRVTKDYMIVRKKGKAGDLESITLPYNAEGVKALDAMIFTFGNNI